MSFPSADAAAVEDRLARARDRHRGSASFCFSSRIELPQPVEDVFRLLTEPALIVERYTAVGFIEVTVSTEAEGIVSRRTDGVCVTQTDAWPEPDADGIRASTWQLGTSSGLVEASGFLDLVPHDGGTALFHEGTIELRSGARAMDGLTGRLSREWDWLAAKCS